MDILPFSKGFQADLLVVLWVPHCDAVPEQHLYVWWPELLVQGHIRVMWRLQGTVHQQLWWMHITV